MTRRDGVLLAGAALFALANAAAAGWAGAMRESLHAAAHVGLMLLGTIWVVRIGTRAMDRGSPALSPADERLERLQQSMDAVALEVERIGEGQRFMTKLQSERPATAGEPRR